MFRVFFLSLLSRLLLLTCIYCDVTWEFFLIPFSLSTGCHGYITHRVHPGQHFYPVYCIYILGILQLM